MNRLSSRLQRIEERVAPPSEYPFPEAGVIYAGDRDPQTIMAALGLTHMDGLTVQVLAEGNPSEAPRLVGPLTARGASGQCSEHAELRRIARQRGHSGGGWSFIWRRDRQGLVLDWSDETCPREFDCRHVPEVSGLVA